MVYGQTGVHHLYAQTGDTASLSWALGLFGPIHKAWTTRMLPGGFLVPHVDPGKPPGYRQRWLLFDNPAGVTYTNGHPLEVQPGDAVPFRQWEPHHVVNNTDQTRTVVVIDGTKIAHPAGDPPHWGFRTLTVTDDVAELIHRTGGTPCRQL